MISRVASAALAVGLLAGGLAGTASIATASGSTAHEASSASAPRTELTLAVTGCEGCELRLTQALNDRMKVWQSKSKKVSDGTVSWNLPKSRTHGLSITVIAPWDGGAGYVPTVAFRYAGEHVGDAVNNATAKSKKHASSCWAGTTKGHVTLPITVVHANSTNPPGDPIKTPRAFTSVTERWEQPMYRVWKGIGGTQDAVYCG
jgi:hypothetical protein